jgi:hypothetical protein
MHGGLRLTLEPSILRTVMMKSPFRILYPILLWFHVIVLMRLFFCVLCFLVPPPLPIPLFALPCRLLAVADALLGMVNINCFFFFLLYTVEASLIA